MNGVTNPMAEKYRVLSQLIIALFVVAIGALFIYASNAFRQGDIRSANAYGGLIVGLATLLLVILTAWYASSTKKLVDQRQEARKEEQQRKLRSLRRGLMYENKWAIK
jgi:cell division protein FtsB